MLQLSDLISDSEGTREDMEWLWNQYLRYMMAVALRLCPHSDEAEDMVMLSVIRLSNHVHDLKCMDVQAQKMYIAKTIRTTVINHSRNNCWLQQNTVELTPELAEQIPSPEGTEHTVLLREEVLRVRRFLAQMPPKQVHALRMKTIGNATDAQVAKVLGIAESSVPQYVRRARLALYSRFMEEGSNDE